MAERDPNQPKRTDHVFQDHQGRWWNHSTVSSTSLTDAQQPPPSSTPPQPILVPHTLSERQAEDDLFQQIERLIRDFLCRPDRRSPYHRIMEWTVPDDPTLQYCAVVIINPPSTLLG